MEALPNDWSAIPLHDPSMFSTTAGLWTGKKSPFKKAHVIRNTNFRDDGQIDYSDVAELDVEVRHLEAKELQSGDIIIERSGGGPKQPVGRVVLFDRDESGFAFSNFTARLRIENRAAFEPRFVNYSLLRFHQSGGTETLQKRTTGIRNLEFTDYLKTPVPCPPLAEQRTIAAVLGKIQAAVAAQQAVIDRTAELKAALMTKLFTEGTRGEPLKETEIGPMPVSWDVKALSDIAAVQRGKFTHRPRNHPAFYGGPIPFIQTGDVTASNGRVTTYSQTLNERGLSVSKMFPKGTILTTIAANIGDFAILDFDCAFPDSIVGITPRDRTLTEFLCYFLQTRREYLNRIAPKGTQKNINLNILSPLPVAIPQEDERSEIVALLSALDQRYRTALLLRGIMSELFAAMLDELMTGRIRANGLELADLAAEPG